ncbi:MAG TPA: carotenoid oxygenase family protein [Pirellulales bacterium]|nr:carotenoid oxygenase family protein [Pirellulales bacterium]
MADTQTVHPHLSGLLAPVRTEDDFELEIVGRIPDALAGAYYRNGPNPQFDPQGPYLSIFGDGMIHAFFLEPNRNGGRARYRNRWVRTPRWQAENEAGRPLFGFMGAPSDPSVADVPRGVANTNVVCHAGKLLALQEQSEPFEIDPAGLERGAYLTTGGQFTAHPKIDPVTGQLVWFAYFVGPQRFSPLIDYGVTDHAGAITRRDRFAAPYAAVIHDFMVTRNYVMFPVLPLTGDLDRAKRGLPPWAWEPAKGAFLGVMKRDAPVDSIRWFEIAPSFVLHAMNAWEEGDKLHCELMEYPSAPVFPNSDGSPGEETHATLTRWTIDLAGQTNGARREQLDDLAAEMPRFDERRAGLPYRHGWYLASFDRGSPAMFNVLAHIDLQTGRRIERILGPGDAADEPIFVPRTADAPEGDGYLLSLIYRGATNTSELLILDAQDIAGEPVALLKLPRRVPAGFHGNFVPAER